MMMITSDAQRNAPFLAARVLNAPLMVGPRATERLAGLVSGQLGLSADALPVAAGDAELPAGGAPYEVTADGVAVLPVRGVLVQRWGLHPSCGITGLDGLRARFAMALADQSVRAIVLDIDADGGEVAGVFDLADAIFAARGTKPIHAILTEAAYASAYAIASACDRITVPRTGGLGSIGVVVMLADVTRAVAAARITVNILQYGARKADLLEFVPLSDAARVHLQRQVDAIGGLFVDTVARNRGVPAARVRATEGATLSATEGLRLGLVDAVAAPDAAYAALIRRTRSATAAKSWDRAVAAVAPRRPRR